MCHKLFPLTALALLLAGMPGVLAQEGDKDLDAVKEFLKTEHGKKNWQTAPSQLASDEVKRAYRVKLKFYFVFSAPPLPPGANLPGVIKAYQKKLKDYRDNYVSATLRVDAEGKVSPLAKVGDYNEGLMAVMSEEDVKTATAAVLTLYGSAKGAPGVVNATEVKVTKTGQGWQGVVDRRNEFQGNVEFNAKGQVIKLSKVFTGPLPP
jgi:hypothetical protein